MILTFENPYFILNGCGILHGDMKGFDVVKGKVATRNLNAAARFRNIADSKAEKIFKKLMLKSLPLPSGGPISPAGMELMDFQRERGIPFILSQNRTYIAHQPGLGKSAQAICAVNTKPGRCLIIVPSFLKTNWAREITKWSIKDFPTIAVVPESAKQNEMNWDADFVICSDSMLLKDWVRHGIYYHKYRFIFIDEGHRFKTFDASRTTALFGGRNGKLISPGLIYNSEHVCVLSGTPMLNRPIELWPLLYAMAPETIDFMNMYEYGFRYCGAWQDDWGRWQFTGSEREEELNERIMGKFMQRIRKEEVLKDLPDKIREVIVMDTDPRAAYVKKFDAQLKKEIKLEELNSIGDYTVIRHLNGLAKVEWAAEFITSLLANDESIIVFAHHRDVVDLLSQKLIAYLPMVINGGVKNEKRVEIEDLFQSGKRRLIIGNIDAMNLGLTLTKATRVVFVEYAWTPSLNEQAEDRAHRIGQKDSVFCQYIVLPDSIDEVILNSLLKKEDSIGKVIG